MFLLAHSHLLRKRFEWCNGKGENGEKSRMTMKSFLRGGRGEEDHPPRPDFNQPTCEARVV
jgi:hypothetical protein